MHPHVEDLEARRAELERYVKQYMQYQEFKRAAATPTRRSRLLSWLRTWLRWAAPLKPVPAAVSCCTDGARCCTPIA